MQDRALPKANSEACRSAGRCGMICSMNGGTMTSNGSPRSANNSRRLGEVEARISRMGLGYTGLGRLRLKGGDMFRNEIFRHELAATIRHHAFDLLCVGDLEHLASHRGSM